MSWQAFDNKLSKHKWMMLSLTYKDRRSQVQAESLDSRLTRFASVNAQRLSSHFRVALERCIGSYRTRRANIAMPAAENDIDTEHRNLAKAIRDMLQEQGQDLIDTEQHRGAVHQLNQVLEEGYYHTRQKNVELWKVHSDEATRCALRENQNLERQCGLLCFFNKVPRVHKTTSRHHLMQCFAKSGAGSRMSSDMQLKVFENWYDKDLAHDAAAVWNNFYIMSGLIGLCGTVLFCGFCSCNPSRGPSRYDYPVYPGGGYR